MKASTAALRLSGALATVCAFLLPLKFGGLAGLPEMPGFYPDSWWDWLIVTWPPALFTIVAGAALLLALSGGAWRRSCPADLRIVCLLWGVLLIPAVLAGFINTAVFDYAESQLVHYAGLGAWCWCVRLLVCSDAGYGRRLFVALAWGTLLTLFSAWYQYFWGFEETRRFFAEAAARGAAAPGVQLQIKLDDDRVYATFASCNSFAGFLLLSGAAAVWFFIRVGDRFEPRRISRVVFGGTAAVLVAGALLMTRSRGAFLCAVLVSVCVFLTSRISRRLRLAAVFAAAAVLAGGAWYVQRAGRGFSSGGERIDYLATSARLTAEHPALGAGWDGFFREHMRSKLSATDEAAHDPHNFIAAFAAQCGIPAGAVAFAALFYPLWAMFRKRREFDRFRFAAFWGCAAGAMHMLMEVDYLSIGDAAVFLLLVELVLAPREIPQPSVAPRPAAEATAAVLCAMLALAAGINFVRGDLAYSRLCETVEPQVGSVWRPPFPEQVERLLEAARTTRPRSPFPLEKAADYHIATGGLTTAKRLLDESLALSGPRPGTFRRLADIAEMSGDTAAAERFRAAARELFPAKYEPRESR